MTMNTDTNTKAKTQFANLVEQWKIEGHKVACLEEDDGACLRQVQIEERIFATPAQDLASLLAKLEIACHALGEMEPNAVAFRSVILDLRRMAKVDVSPLFDAANWLEEFAARGGCHVVRDGEAFLCQKINSGVETAYMLDQLASLNGSEAVKAHLIATAKGLCQ